MNIGNFSFYPVGQGCFYAGKIMNKFTVVFDCGSISRRIYLDNAIDAFKLKHKKIDLLVISHFDEDHVNGVADLLNGTPCGKVVIPYYDPILRLTLYGDSNSDNEDYISFLTNPTEFFLSDRFNVDEVIIIGNNGETFINDNIKPQPPKESNEEIDIENEKPLSISFNKEEDNSVKDYIQNIEEISNTNKVKYFTLPFSLTIGIGIWEFVFYLKFFDQQNKITNFENAINNLLKETNTANINSLFDNKFRKRIRKIYSTHIHKRINYTSLVLYHGPIMKIIYHVICTECFDSWCFHQESKKTGTILTGDLYLSTRKDFNAFYNYYQPHYIDKCEWLQVPHHGSKSNWKNLPNGLENITHYIINHGLRRKHPYAEVIDNILEESKSKQIHLNNETHKVCYSMFYFKIS
ncbi:MAG: MBL fold metallo-hydrolase [Bacteroidota bacterium]